MACSAKESRRCLSWYNCISSLIKTAGLRDFLFMLLSLMETKYKKDTALMLLEIPEPAEL